MGIGLKLVLQAIECLHEEVQELGPHDPLVLLALYPTPVILHIRVADTIEVVSRTIAIQGVGEPRREATLLSSSVNDILKTVHEG